LLFSSQAVILCFDGILGIFYENGLKKANPGPRPTGPRDRPERILSGVPGSGEGRGAGAGTLRVDIPPEGEVP